MAIQTFRQQVAGEQLGHEDGEEIPLQPSRIDTRFIAVPHLKAQSKSVEYQRQLLYTGNSPQILQQQGEAFAWQ